MKNEPKGKEKLIEHEPIIDNEEDEEPDEAELKRRKARDAEINETQRIVKEVKQKEKAEREAQATLKSRMLLFPKSYFQEVGSIDVDIATILKKKPIVVPKEALKDLEKLNLVKIYKEGWFVVYQSIKQTGADFRKSYFHIEDKHI
ncbi:unnamed protein product [Lactuca saligna]|uniref:Uncharacterized protein n=1 Tax=Lactuca saligna TaxID=75948 RepID=A0AA36E124_LACSI|nr:unnamed protein product [Lactuca saligna]